MNAITATRQALRAAGATDIRTAKSTRQILAFQLDADTLVDVLIPALQALPFRTAFSQSDITSGRFSLQVG